MNVKYFTNLDIRKYRFGIDLEQRGWRPKAGDTVVIKDTSRYISQAPNGIVGTITKVNGDCISVVWSKGSPNTYSKSDLYLVIPVVKLSEKKTAERLPTMDEFLKAMPAPVKKAPVAKKAAPVAKPKVVPAPVAPPPVQSKSAARLPTLDMYVASKKTQAAIAAGTLKIKEVRPMSTGIVARIKSAAQKNVNGQCDFGKQALTLEAARILNDTLVKVITPKLPIMVRGYAKEPLGKAVIANALNIAMEAALVNVPANDPRKKVAEAAVVMAYQEFLAGFKAEDLLAELFNTPALSAILGKLED